MFFIESHRLEIVFVIESSAWLCLFCWWDQFLLCPRLTHSWCFSGVSTTTTTGSYILFIWQAVTFDNNNNIDGTSLCCVLDWGSYIFFIWKEAGFVKNNNSSCIDTLLYLSDKQLLMSPLRPTWAHPVSCFCFSKSCFKQISENQGWKALGSSRKGGFILWIAPSLCLCVSSLRLCVCCTFLYACMCLSDYVRLCLRIRK